MPRHLSKKGRYVAINGSEKRWAAAITGLQALPGSQYRLILVRNGISEGISFNGIERLTILSFEYFAG